MATTPKNDDTKAAKVDDLGASEVQARFDEANAKGYFGETPDETPNENYTLAGVTSGKPTPETERGKK
jgi:hypothetical protein